jgi:hypothetical protein
MKEAGGAIDLDLYAQVSGYPLIFGVLGEWRIELQRLGFRNLETDSRGYLEGISRTHLAPDNTINI